MSSQAPSTEAGAAAAAVHSMTGFGEGRRTGAGWDVTVTMKSVNHRFLDPRWQAPGELERLIPELEKRLRAELRRGHVEVRVSLAAAGGAGAASRLDPEVVEAYLAAHAELSRRLGVRQEIAVSEILRVPGAWSADAGADAAEAAPLVTEAFGAALAALREMRRREGAALVEELQRRLAAVGAGRERLSAHRRELEAGWLERLQRRLQELAGELFASHPERLLQEAALAAERGDISEELARLETHETAFRELLAGGGEVGKKLDFLVQEMNREVNTLLSKTTTAAPAALQLGAVGLELKSEIEKIREQVQNLE